MFDRLGHPIVSNFLGIWAAGRMALAGQAAATYDWNAFCAPLYPVFVDGIVPLLSAVYPGLLVWVVLRARTVGARIDLDTGLIARTP